MREMSHEGDEPRGRRGVREMRCEDTVQGGQGARETRCKGDTEQGRQGGRIDEVQRG